MFQSMPPRGGQLHLAIRAGRGKGVSIHAPAWGATSSPLPPPRCTRGFNPCPRVGGNVLIGECEPRT